MAKWTTPVLVLSGAAITVCVGTLFNILVGMELMGFLCARREGGCVILGRTPDLHAPSPSSAILGNLLWMMCVCLGYMTIYIARSFGAFSTMCMCCFRVHGSTYVPIEMDVIVEEVGMKKD